MNLTTKQILFCKLYTQNRELFGNATLSYAEAFKIKLEGLSKINKLDKNGKIIPRSSPYDKKYDMCSASSSRLLRNVKINEFCTKCLNELMNDEVVDGELARVIIQNHELPSKISAIREYNKLKQRIIEKNDLTSGGKPLEFTVVKYNP